MTDAVGHWLAAAGRQPLLTPAEELHLGAAIRRWMDWEGGLRAIATVARVVKHQNYGYPLCAP